MWRTRRILRLIHVLVGAAFVVLTTHIALSGFDLVERWLWFSQEYEEWDLDELPLIFLTLLLYFTVVLFFQLSENAGLIERLMDNVKRRQAAQLELKKALASREGFFAAMSHDLRTPVNSITGFAEIMKNEMFGPLNNPKYQEYVSFIHRAGSMLDNSISQILEVSRINDSSDLVVQDDIFDPLEEIEFCRDLVSGWGGLHRAILVTADVQGACIRFDRGLFRRYIINLLANAIKYAGSDAQVGVHLMHTGIQTGMTLTVYDDGEGVSIGSVRDVVHPFKRVENSEDGFMSSAGLGLWIVKNIAEAHDCGFSVISDDGHGFRVIMTIPADRVIDKADLAESSLASAS